MEPSRRAPGYDLFKLIVAIILLVLFFILNIRSIPPSQTAISTIATVPISVPASRTTFAPPTITNTPVPSPTAENTAEPAAPPLPSPTATSPTQPIATPTSTAAQTPAAETPVASACESASSRSRLHPGMNAKILRRLNFRSSPGIANNWLRTNLPGTKVEVIGGPECIPHVAGAYVWWQIKLPGGQTGWSAESSQFGLFYFIEPSSQ